MSGKLSAASAYTKSATIVSWKTTLLGALLAVWGIAEGVVRQLNEGQPIDWKTVITSVAVALVAFFAKDHNTTGGTNVNVQ